MRSAAGSNGGLRLARTGTVVPARSIVNARSSSQAWSIGVSGVSIQPRAAMPPRVAPWAAEATSPSHRTKFKPQSRSDRWIEGPSASGISATAQRS